MRTGLSGDVFYQLAAGQWMLAHHAVIRHDVFSYTVNGRLVVRRRVGLRGTAGLVGKASRHRFVLAGLCWSLCGRPARRRGPVEEDRRRLALDGRPVRAWPRPASQSGLRLARRTSVISSSPCCYFCSRWADAATAGSSRSALCCSFGPTCTGAFCWAWGTRPGARVVVCAAGQGAACRSHRTAAPEGGRT